MRCILKHIDVVDEKADALIYSTNVLLNCSGGVGSCLVEKYGKQVQEDLHALLKDDGRKFANQGEVFEKVSAGMSYKKVFHTVPNDPMYNTNAVIIESILCCCLSIANADTDVRSVAVSALATGYGKLFFDDFFRIVAKVAKENQYDDIDTLTICSYDSYSYKLACEQIESEGIKITPDHVKI